MKASRLCSVTLIFCAAAALLRLWQTLTGFDADTHLSLTGHPAAVLLAAVLLAAALVLFFITAPLKGRRVRADKLTLSPACRRLVALGGALFLAAALLSAAERLPSLLAALESGSISGLSGLYVPLFTALVLGCGGAFLLRAASGRVDAVPAPAGEGKVMGGLSAALPGFGCCMLLVTVYQSHANDPAVQRFLWPEIALFLGMLAWYALSGLWYMPANRRRLVWCCLTAAVAQCGALCAPEGAFSPAILAALLGNLVCFVTLGLRLARPRRKPAANP